MATSLDPLRIPRVRTCTRRNLGGASVRQHGCSIGVASHEQQAPNMTIWVVRKSLDGDMVGPPRLCAKPGRAVRIPGLLTIEEQIAILLNDRETVQDIAARGRWSIFEGNRPTGFIEVLDEHQRPSVL
jgi:hypothetical protein